MPLHKLLLRMMLWSLALAAAAGVLAAIAGGGDTVWRVVGTGFVTALACGLMMPFSAMLDRERMLAFGLSGIAVVLIEYLLALALIWEMAWRLFGLRWEEELAVTMLFFGLAAVLLALSVKLAGTSHSGLAGNLGVGTTAATFGIFLVGIWGPEHLIHDEKWWESGFALFSIGLLVLLSLIRAGTPPYRPWRWLAPPAGVIAFLLWMSHVWLDTESALGTVVLAVLVSLAAVVVYANLSLLVTLTAKQAWLRRGAIVAAVLAAMVIDLLTVEEVYETITWNADLLGRLAAAAGIVAGCGLMALLVLARINRGVASTSPAAELTVVGVTCPRCRKKQSIRIGEASCSRCGLRIWIRVAEPL